MKRVDGRLRLSPTDLSNFLSCRHRNVLELSASQGLLKKPVRSDPLIETLVELGLRHEREYVKKLRDSGKRVVDLTDYQAPSISMRRTIEAMRDGAEVIVQGGLGNERWFGFPDILLRVPAPSPVLGDWSYQPADTKLTQETRGATILQLGLYCELLEHLQGVLPENFHVITPPPDGATEQVHHSYRTQEYAAYLRLMKRRLEMEVQQDIAALKRLHQPDPVEHCTICNWFGDCMNWWRQTDHLALVAGISKMQRRELPTCGIATMAALAQTQALDSFRPLRGSTVTYERVRDQAKIQVQSRDDGELAFEPIPTWEQATDSPISLGLARLPQPCPGDLFLDLEGDPFGGRDYLFGLLSLNSQGQQTYRHWWAHTPAEEREAFERVIDTITERIQEYPNAHIYHYAPYEPSAFKRLMGRYATREEQFDALLRGRRFVDLYAVVRQGFLVGVERYSIKNLEPLYGYHRDVELQEAARTLKHFEQALELGRGEAITDKMRETVLGYNRDDCVSTKLLRDWLEERRQELVDQGAAISRPALADGAPSDKVDEAAQRVETLRAELLRDVSIDPQERAQNQEMEANYQLAYLLDWHRREDKAKWWEYFRLCALSSGEILEEKKIVGGLVFERTVEQRKRSFVQSFQYPDQEAEFLPGDSLENLEGTSFGKVVSHHPETNRLDILVGPSKSQLRPSTLVIKDIVGVKPIIDSLLALGDRAVLAGGVVNLPDSAQRELLMRCPPRLTGEPFSPPMPGADTSVTDYAINIVTRLDRTVLAIQGPPGAGKTYTGSRMVVAALKAGLKVGVTATSHKVIRNFMEAVDKRARDDGVGVGLLHKCDNPGTGNIASLDDNGQCLDRLRSGAFNVLGGTAWMWAREEFEDSVDVLFVDEAGQISLANVLGLARGAKSLVLLGDPAQLEQPSQGSHPEGIGASALQYILGTDETIPPERGLFLPTTWRLSPAICAFTSEQFYASQLSSKAGLENQTLRGGRFDGGGLWLVELEHRGNTSASDEEAAELARIVANLLEQTRWVDKDGTERQMTCDDIRIVAPFNAHVQRINTALKTASLTGVPVGTVDKFQGQEAAVAIYSMASSSPEDAPRGLEFLFSPNRLNVATSRARCAAIVVASPKLFEPDCQTPRQMKLANTLCRYREMARVRGWVGDESRGK